MDIYVYSEFLCTLVAAQSEENNQHGSVVRALPTTLFCFIIATCLKSKPFSELFRNKFHIL